MLFSYTSWIRINHFCSNKNTIFLNKSAQTYYEIDKYSSYAKLNANQINWRLENIVDDDVICTEKIIADRKTFFLDLKQNARGKVIRITEKVSNNRDRIMVPAEVLDDFIAALEDIRRTMNGTREECEGDE